MVSLPGCASKMGRRSALTATRSETTTTMSRSCLLPSSRVEEGGGETPGGSRVSCASHGSSSRCSRPFSSVAADRSSGSSVKEEEFCMVPFLLLVPLTFPWRSLLLALYDRGSGEGPFCMRKLNGFTCTWNVLYLLDANSEQDRSPRVTVGKKMRGR